jgi:hypothetical protein
MPKKHDYPRLARNVRNYWEERCSDYSPDCIRALGDVINEFIEWSWQMHENAVKPQPDHVARANIESGFNKVKDILFSEIVPDVARLAYEKLYETRHRWFSEATSNVIADAFVRSIVENPEYTTRDVVESMISQTGLSPVTIRHWFEMMAREYPEYSEFGTEARRIEREMLGV